MMILTATIGFGLIPIFAQIMLQKGFDADSITLYRFLIPTLVFILWFRPKGLDVAEVIRTLLLGVFGGLGMVLFMRALSGTSATTVILLYYCYPFFTIVLGNLFFKQQFSRNSLSAALIILVAASLTLNPESIAIDDLPIIIGSLMAPVSFALMIQYFSYPVKVMPATQRMIISLSGTLAAIIPCAFLFGSISFLPDQPQDLVWIFAIGLISAAIPQYLFIKGAPRAGATATASISSLEVVVAILMASFVLSQNPNRLQITAAALIVIAQLIRQDPDKSSLPATNLGQRT